MAVSDGEQLMLYKDLGMIAHGPRRATPAEPARPASRSPTAATPRPARRSGRTPSRRTGWVRAGRSRSATTATSSTPASCSPSSPAAAPRLARLDRHGAADRAPRRRAGRGHGRGAHPGPAARPRARSAWSSSTSSASSGSAIRTASGRSSWAACPRWSGRTPARPCPSGLWGDDDLAGGWCLSSETAALDIVGAEYVRDVEPGEIVILEPGQPPRSVRFAEATRSCACSSSSTSPGRTRTWRVATCTRSGGGWASSSPSSTRSTPTSSCRSPTPAPRRRPATPRRAGSPYREGMYRNRYAGRTFIQPSQGMRQRGVTIKLNPLREVVAGKRLIVVDDSIVRGTTTKQIVELLRKAGAREVHVRISAPPIYHPCFYGIDTQIETELIASTHNEAADPRVHRRRFARLPLDPRRPRRARAAVRPVLLRLLRRPLPGARAVRRGEPQVRARGDPAVRASRDAVRLTADRGRAAYRRAGVDVEAGERAVELMRGARRVDAPARGRRRARRLRRRVRDPGRATASRCSSRRPTASGTKTAIAAALGRFDTIGIDLVAMCADDVVCSGAEPLVFLDYVAVGRLDPGRRRRARRRRRGRLSRWPAARSSAARPPSTRG